MLYNQFILPKWCNLQDEEPDNPHFIFTDLGCWSFISGICKGSEQCKNCDYYNKEYIHDTEHELEVMYFQQLLTEMNKTFKIDESNYKSDYELIKERFDFLDNSLDDDQDINTYENSKAKFFKIYNILKFAEPLIGVSNDGDVCCEWRMGEKKIIAMMTFLPNKVIFTLPSTNLNMKVNMKNIDEVRQLMHEYRLLDYP